MDTKNYDIVIKGNDTFVYSTVKTAASFEEASVKGKELLYQLKSLTIEQLRISSISEW